MERVSDILDEVTSEWGLMMSMPNKIGAGRRKVRTRRTHSQHTSEGEAIKVVTDTRIPRATIESHDGITKDVEDNTR